MDTEGQHHRPARQVVYQGIHQVNRIRDQASLPERPLGQAWRFGIMPLASVAVTFGVPERERACGKVEYEHDQ